MKPALRPSLWALSMVLGVLVAGRGCKPPTRDNPATCDPSNPSDVCGTGKTCMNNLCVPTGGVGGTQTGDAGSGGMAGGDGESGGDAGGGGGAPNGGAGVTGSGGETGGGGEAGGGSTGAAGSGGTPADGGVDAGNHCETSTDCTGKPGTPACEPTKKMCVGCVSVNDCSGATPACDTNTNTCVECFADDKWCATPQKAFCGSGDVCVGCGAKTGACKAGSAKPVCDPGGACVACDADKDCPDAKAPFCASNTCVPCNDTSQSTTACANQNPRTPVCNATGACVECGADKDCTSDPTKPFCSAAGACVPCQSAVTAGGCMTLTPTKPVCASSGACVQCVGNSDCPRATPVCSSGNTCGACTADTDCANRSGPGVCMVQKDGSCAADSETIYVQNNSSCSESGGTSGGTAAVPFCSMQPATAVVSASRDLVIVRGTVGGAANAFAANVAIIGQSSGAIVGSVNPALHIASGTTYARDLTLSTEDSIGFQADSGSTVQLEHLLVTDNMGRSTGSGTTRDSRGGGILLDGAAFDIHNTTVSNNGPGTINGNIWGGIQVNNPPDSGHKSLQLVTVQGNNPVGISCTAMITGVDVLVTGNTSADITSTCGFTSCGTAGPTCGAQQ